MNVYGSFHAKSTQKTDDPFRIPRNLICSSVRLSDQIIKCDLMHQQRKPGNEAKNIPFSVNTLICLDARCTVGIRYFVHVSVHRLVSLSVRQILHI